MSEVYIPARPTTYRGIPMRSRLEARVAADLDGGEMPWTYEPRAFADPNGQYLPDFQIELMPGTPSYLEVKPTVAAAYRVLPRMQIIWSSEPTAWLFVAVPEDGFVLLGRAGSWQITAWGYDRIFVR